MEDLALQPLYDRLIVRVVDSESVTAAGVILPDNAQEKSTRAEVIAVGPGARLDSGELVPVDVEVGDTVYFTKYGGHEVSVAGDTLLILREQDVLAKVVE